MAAFALPETNDCFEQRLDAYSQKHRHYHTVVRRNLRAAIAALRGE